MDTPCTPDVIPMAEAATLPALFRRRCERSPQAEAYRRFEPASRQWRGSSWDEVAGAVARRRAGLARERLVPGDRIAILLPNGIDWVCMDQAAQSIGLVVVPLYATDNAGNLAYILGDSGTRLLVVADAQRWEQLAPLRAQMPELQRVVSLQDPAGGDAAGILRGLQDWLHDAPPAEPAPDPDPQALATIVYTSGTTGRPKGVMLSHRNLLTNVEAVLRTTAIYREDLFLSFLPLSHALERTVGYYLPMAAGSTVAFARSVQDLAEDLQAVRPTALVSVPRIYERVYARLQQQLETAGTPARQLFGWAESIGWRRFEAAQHRGEGPGVAAGLMWPVLRHLVADKLQARLGGRLRVAVSGGAPVSARLMHCFLGLGLPVLQGYGLTEASPVVSANTLEDNLPETVGKPLPGVEVRLGERDEVLVRGPSVMMGYWRDPAKTRDAIDADGWLRTGDIGRLDAEGRLSIVGRLKDILVTSTGEKVPPSDVELAILEDPLFDQVMVLGEGRPFVSALVVLNPDAWRELAGHLHVPAGDQAALQDPRVHQHVLQRLQARLEAFPSYAQVRKAVLSLQSWTVDEGLITPTLKLRRPQLEARFGAQIRELYEGR